MYTFIWVQRVRRNMPNYTRAWMGGASERVFLRDLPRPIFRPTSAYHAHVYTYIYTPYMYMYNIISRTAYTAYIEGEGSRTKLVTRGPGL